MYGLLYIFICQLSSAAESENGRKYEAKCGVCCWWPCAVVVAIGWAVVEIEEVDGGGALMCSPRGIGADLAGCHSAVKTTMIYIHVHNHGSESVRSPVGGL